MESRGFAEGVDSERSTCDWSLQQAEVSYWLLQLENICFSGRWLMTVHGASVAAGSVLLVSSADVSYWSAWQMDVSTGGLGRRMFPTGWFSTWMLLLAGSADVSR